MNGCKAPVANICVWPCRLLLHWTKMAAEPVVGFDSVPDFSTPTASRTVIVRKSRIQSLITFIPSRAGRSTAGRAVGCGGGGGKPRREKLQPQTQRRADRANTQVTHTHPTLLGCCVLQTFQPIMCFSQPLSAAAII